MHQVRFRITAEMWKRAEPNRLGRNLTKADSSATTLRLFLSLQPLVIWPRFIPDFPQFCGMICHDFFCRPVPALECAGENPRILKSATPSDLSVMQAVKVELVINLKTAKTLGLDVSPAPLTRADEVVE